MGNKISVSLRYSTKKTKDILGEFSKEFWFAPQDIFLRVTETLIWSSQRLLSPILDIGCGDGRISRFLFANQKLIDVGLDVDPKEVSVARLSGIYRKLVVANAAKMPFEKESFRTVLSNSTFEHIEGDVEAVGEVSRVLMSKGCFLFTVPTKRLKSTLMGIIRDEEGFIKFNARVSHFHYRSLSEWQKILEHKGFELECCEYYLPRELVGVWYRLFRLATFRPYRRELWSYMKDSPYGRLLPRRFISFLVSSYLLRFYKSMFSKEGTWMFIVARKKK